MKETSIPANLAVRIARKMKQTCPDLDLRGDVASLPLLDCPPHRRSAD